MRITRPRERKVGQRITALKETIQEELAKGKTIRAIAREYDIKECTLGLFIRYWKSGVKYKPGEKKNRPPAKRRYVRIDKKKEPDLKPKKYRYHWTGEENSREMACILAAAREIHWFVFFSHVEKEYLDNFKRIASHNIKEDNRIRYYKSVTLEGKEVYYFTLCDVKYVFY
jgi:transposase-like protein